MSTHTPPKPIVVLHPAIANSLTDAQYAMLRDGGYLVLRSLRTRDVQVLAPPVESKPPLMCRLFGHKWHERITIAKPPSFDDYVAISSTTRPFIVLERDLAASHCRRCGAPNPGVDRSAFAPITEEEVRKLIADVPGAC